MKTCPICSSSDFQNRPYALYCSEKCCKEAARRKAKVSNEKKRLEAEKLRPLRPCSICGDIFKPYSSVAKYCGHKCREAGFQAAISKQKAKRKDG
jgi:hypothetical protein